VAAVTDAPTTTANAISPDSGEHWAAPGAWQVEDGLFRLPLPLPMDGLRAVNVYVLVADDGLSLVDGGWAVEEGRAALEAGLARIGAGFGDIRRFLVTHAHRDHYTLASVLGEEYDAHVSLGEGERASLDLMHRPDSGAEFAMLAPLRRAGAFDLSRRMEEWVPPERDMREWRYPDTWLRDRQTVEVAGRRLDTVHTPGHTRGHFVFADTSGGVLFAGDHVLPTITPSIGFEAPAAASPLADFLSSLAKVRALPDLRLLPAHGPVAPSSHARVEELLAHHEQRLELSLEAVRAGRSTARDVAADLPWTRRGTAYADLDLFNAMLATLETHAHLEVLAARGLVTRNEDGTDGADGAVTFTALD
jgi:glyoxylase-like metal-dependent hydrolase (beta-lactamase superfamily II)